MVISFAGQLLEESSSMLLEFPISSFSGDYRFLSNFYYSIITVNGMTFQSVEHAFQSWKMTNLKDALHVAAQISPADAKKEARKLQRREDWDLIKRDVMYECCKVKFAQDPLRSKLIETSGRELIEGNTWKDTYWGVYNGRGENWLGIILMRIRDEHA